MLACQYNQPKRPGDLDLLTLKVVLESRVTWATSVPILVFLGLSVFDLSFLSECAVLSDLTVWTLATPAVVYRQPSTAYLRKQQRRYTINAWI